MLSVVVVLYLLEIQMSYINIISSNNYSLLYIYE